MSADPELPRRADVVVVGAGHNGLVSAVLLARAGLEVVVLEAAEVAHLGYFGNFYATRGLDDVLAALAALAGDDPVTGERVRLHVFTTKPEELDRRARELGVAGLVRVGPYLRYLEFLRLTRELDCLIVNDAATRERHGRNPYLPSKWADYRGSGTPVWGIVEPGSPLSGEPLDYASPIGDVAAAREVLSVIARKKLAG